jgi:hypothetical protein
VQFLARTSLSPQGPVSPPFATNIRRIETAVAHHPVQMAAVLLSWQCAAAQRLAWSSSRPQTSVPTALCLDTLHLLQGLIETPRCQCSCLVYFNRWIDSFIL